MAETSHLKDDLKKAGEEGKKSFLDGFGMNDLGGKMGEGLLDGLKHSELTGGMTAILTGGIAGMVGAFVEKGLDVINAAFEGTIDLAKEAAESIMEIGESWHEVGRQLELSTTASGAALEDLNRSAQNVVRSGLDTSMKGLGSTMGVLAQRIGMTGQPLETLTKDLLRVQDRFGQFKTGDFAAILKEFDVGPADASKALEQLVNASRATSVGLPEIIAGAKDTGSVFHQLGLDAGEAGALVAQLSAAGISTAPVLKALQASAKKLPPGESLADEIKGIIDQLDKAIKTGDVHTEQSLAAKLFGPKWADALTAIQKGLLDTGTLIATFSNDGGQNLDQLLDHTATLGNKWQELQNDASEALKPLGETAIAIVEGPLEHFKGWFDQNHDQIVGKIKDFGDKFIDALPTIKEFVAEALDIMGPLANGVKEMGTLVSGTFLPLIEAWALVSGNDKLLANAQALGENLNKVEKTDLSKVFTDASDAVHNMNIDTGALKQNLDDAADASDRMGGGLSALSSAWGVTPGLGKPSGESPSTSTGSDGKTYQVAPSALSIPMPPSGPVPTGGSATRDKNALDIITQAKAMGFNKEQTLAALGVGIQETGLGTNPRTNVAQNQSGTVVQGEFQQDGGYAKYGDRTNPSNSARGFLTEFAKRGQGLNDPNPWRHAVSDVQIPAQAGRGGYNDSDGSYLRNLQRGAALDYYNRLAGDMPTSGGGGDDVFGYGPKLDLSPSSFRTDTPIVPAAPGSVPTQNAGDYHPQDLYGAKWVPGKGWVRPDGTVAQPFKSHGNPPAVPAPPSGGAILLPPPSPGNGGSQSPLTDFLKGLPNVPPSVPIPGASGGDTVWSQNLANAAPIPPGADGRTPSAFDNAAAPGDSDTPGSMPAPNIPMPALTGNYEIDSRNLQLVQAQIAIEQKQQAIGVQVQKIADMQADPTTDPQKLADAQQKLSSDQQGLAVDQEKLQLDQEKPLKGSNKGLETDAQQFGSGFLKGIFSDLGFGNVMGGKSPLDWGITKLLGGLAGWGIGEANSWADGQLAQGALGQGGQQSGGVVQGGILNGFLKDLIPNALNPFKPGAALGPSGAVNATQGMPNVSGAFGAAPGPVTYDNRIQVSGNTLADPYQLVPPMQEKMNSNSNFNAPTGGPAVVGGGGG